jgi:hypothetical protein
MTIPKSLFRPAFRPGGTMRLHQSGVIIVVLSRLHGAINTGYVH